MDKHSLANILIQGVRLSLRQDGTDELQEPIRSITFYENKAQVVRFQDYQHSAYKLRNQRWVHCYHGLARHKADIAINCQKFACFMLQSDGQWAHHNGSKLETITKGW